MLHVRTIDRYPDFLDLRARWDALFLADPEAQFFLSWQWLSGVLQAHPGEWLVLLAENTEGDLVGCFPLRVRTVWSDTHHQVRTELHFAGRLFWADYGGMLLRPPNEAVFIDALAARLKDMNWSHLILKGFRTSEARMNLFLHALRDPRLRTTHRQSRINGEATDNLVAPHIALPGMFEDWMTGQLSSNTRQKVRRFTRKLESSDEYHFTESNRETLLRDTLILQALWSRQWGPEKGTETPRLAHRYGQILRDGFERGLLHQLLLWNRQRPIGVLASFIDQPMKRLHFFVGGRDPDFNAFPVGLVMHAYNIRLAIHAGFGEYDFLRGDEPYKYSLGAVDRRLYYPCVITQSGTNLNDGLDPVAIQQALSIAREFSEKQIDSRAGIILQQVCSTALQADVGNERRPSLSPPPSAPTSNLGIG